MGQVGRAGLRSGPGTDMGWASTGLFWPRGWSAERARTVVGTFPWSLSAVWRLLSFTSFGIWLP